MAQQIFVSSSKLSAPVMTSGNRDTKKQCGMFATFCVTSRHEFFVCRNFCLSPTEKLTRQSFSKYICDIKIGQYYSSARENQNVHIKFLLLTRLNSHYHQFCITTLRVGYKLAPLFHPIRI